MFTLSTALRSLTSLARSARSPICTRGKGIDVRYRTMSDVVEQRS
jgi:hypothetical protein